LAALARGIMRQKKHKRIFVFDTSVLIDYLNPHSAEHDVAADAFAFASQIGEIWLTIISMLELHSPARRDKEIQADLDKVKQLQRAYRLRVIPIPEEAQWFALNVIARYYRSILGRNLLSDSLILGCGMKKSVCLVTRDQNWLQLLNDTRRPPGLQVITSTQLVQNIGEDTR